MKIKNKFEQRMFLFIILLFLFSYKLFYIKYMFIF